MLGLLVVVALLMVPGFPAVVLGLLVATLGLLLVVTSGGGGSRLTRSGIGGTRLGIARRVRPRCRWLMAATG